MDTGSVEKRLRTECHTLQEMLDLQISAYTVKEEEKSHPPKPRASTQALLQDNNRTDDFISIEFIAIEIHRFASNEAGLDDNFVSYIRAFPSTSSPLHGKIPIPDNVLSCKPALISCTIRSPSWKSADLLLWLFSEGHISAQFKHSFSASGPFSGTSVENLQVKPVLNPIPPARRPETGHISLSGYHSIGRSPASNFGSPASFMTASSPASFMTARSSYNTPAFMSASGFSSYMIDKTIREDEPPEPGLSAPLVQLHNDYYTNLHQQEIIQPFDKELNWSGKGQHVTYSAHEAIPLSSISHLGSSMSATVDKVVCRRIALARKTMRCSRKWSVVDTLREVYHLQNLRHFHIVQLVGTYLSGRNFSILMYPAADMHLGRFMEDTSDMDKWSSFERRFFLASTMGCLTSAVAFIHQHTTKHMDIKPQNILIRDTRPEMFDPDWRVYIADFGLSRSFASQDHSQTDGPTSRTPRYCAPEVYNSEERGRSADIFSLGCVYLEILTTICCIDLHTFSTARRGERDDESFHANLERVVEWADSHLKEPIEDIPIHPEIIVDLFTSMVSREPSSRPTAAQIHDRLKSIRSGTPYFNKQCCHLPPEPYEAYRYDLYGPR